MDGESICEVCGNEVDPALARCPFCGDQREAVSIGQVAEQLRVINLERGMPLVRDALKRLEMEEDAASRAGCKALVLIHGYGSSGRGGEIKKAVRRKLQSDAGRRVYNEVIPGEECSKRSGRSRQLVKRFPLLEEFVRQSNPGITVVIL